MFYIFGEIKNGSTVQNFRTVQNEGSQTVTREHVHYKLDRINSIGYREKQGTPLFTIKNHELVQ
jgi:hypothetical protein